jgi:hypothetical protein
MRVYSGGGGEERDGRSLAKCCDYISFHITKQTAEICMRNCHK